MSCTIFYVDNTEALMGKESKNRLLSLLKQRWEDTRGENSFFIVILSKYSKQAFKEAEKWIRRAFLSTLCYHRSVPSPYLEINSPSYPPLISNLFLLPPLFNPTLSPCWDWAHDDDNFCHRTPPSPTPAPRVHVRFHVHIQWSYWRRERPRGGICIL